MGIFVVILAVLLLSDTNRNIAKLEGSQFYPSKVRGPMYEARHPENILQLVFQQLFRFSIKL
jgi:hypothetical protein